MFLPPFAFIPTRRVASRPPENLLRIFSSAATRIAYLSWNARAHLVLPTAHSDAETVSLISRSSNSSLSESLVTASPRTRSHAWGGSIASWSGRNEVGGQRDPLRAISKVVSRRFDRPAVDLSKRLEAVEPPPSHSTVRTDGGSNRPAHPSKIVSGRSDRPKTISKLVSGRFDRPTVDFSKRLAAVEPPPDHSTPRMEGRSNRPAEISEVGSRRSDRPETISETVLRRFDRPHSRSRGDSRRWNRPRAVSDLNAAAAPA
jgi:hypothetical protein